MWKLLVMWAMLAACIYCAANWFVIPMFPAVAQVLPAMTIGLAVGSSAIVMIVGMLFGKGK